MIFIIHNPNTKKTMMLLLYQYVKMKGSKEKKFSYNISGYVKLAQPSWKSTW